MNALKKIFTLFTGLLMLLCRTNSFGQHTHSYSSIEYIENQGQWDAPFLFKGTTPLGDIYLRKEGFRILLSDAANHDKKHGLRHGWVTGPQTLRYHAFDILFDGANQSFEVTTEKPQPVYYNYFLGKDPAKWKSNIHPVMAVNYKNIYNNIDAHIYSEEGNIKYDLIVHPGASSSDIHLKYDGIDKMKIDQGKLVLTTSLGDIKESEPYTYQFINGEKKIVKCNFVLKDNKISFDLPKGYNHDYDLYIDPTLVFCTFTGSTADNWGFTATYDSSGNFYAGGITSGTGYPVTPGAYDTTYDGGTTTSGSQFPCDVTISKFNPTGATLLYATYLGGSDNEQPQSIIVDHNQNLCIAGRTYSADFPTSVGCYDPSYNGGGDMFVTKLNPSGSALVGSTFVGGTAEDAANEEALEFVGGILKHNYGDDARSEIIHDANNNVYIAACSKSTNFPITASAFQSTLAGAQDAVIVELNDNLSNLIWSTFAGGFNNDAAYVVSLNKTNPNELFVGGGTLSSNFPSTAGTLHSSYQGGDADGFVMKFNTTTKALMASTFIGTSAYDQVYGVQTDDSNHLYIMGQTLGAYPTTAGVYSNPNSSQYVSKLDNNLTSILVSTVFGTGTTAATNISPNAFLVDKCQNVYVSGWGGAIGGPFNSSTMGLPTMNPLQGTTDGNDFYFIVFSKNLTSLLYASFFGQNGGISEHVDGGTSRFDENGVIYQAICAACGASTIFPTTNGSYSPNNPSPNCNLAALKISFDLQDPDAVASIIGDTISCSHTVVFVNNSSSATGYLWDFGDGTTYAGSTSPYSHTYTNAGTYTVTLVAFNPNGCTSSVDSTSMIIVIKDDSIHAAFTITKVDSCKDFTATFTNTSTNTSSGAGTVYQWTFGDGTSYTGANPALHDYPAASTYTVTLTMTDPDACNSPSVFQAVVDFSVSNVKSAFQMPDSVCMPAVVNFLDQSTNATTWNWNFGDGQTSTQTNPTNTFSAPGTFTVTLVSGNPNTCNKLDTTKHVITVLASPVADFDWAPNPPQPNTPNIFTNLSTGATSYLWNFGDGGTSILKDDIHIYQKDGYYNVCLTAKNEVGCIDTACKTVRGLVIPLVDVPTGFSPNGDGVNDMVYVKGYGIQTMLFRIYNRWGEKVFETTDQSKGWDGRYKNEMQEMEVYGYTLKVLFFDGTSDSKSGNITLLK